MYKGWPTHASRGDCLDMGGTVDPKQGARRFGPFSLMVVYICCMD